MALQRNHEADIQRLLATQFPSMSISLLLHSLCTRDHQLAIAQLQEQVQALQVSLASQRDLPLVGVIPRGGGSQGTSI